MFTIEKVIRHLSKELPQLQYQNCVSVGRGVPGEYRLSSYNIIMDALIHDENLSDSVFLDIGFGLGKAVFVASYTNKFRECIGLEIEESLCNIANQTAREFKFDCVNFIHTDASHSIPVFATHIYIFSLGMPPSTIEGVSRQLNKFKWSRMVSSHPIQFWKKCGLVTINNDAKCIKKLRMFGSGRQYCMYLIIRT